MRWCWVVLLAGCYQPATYDSCVTACGLGPALLCPPDQTCDDNGVCKPRDLVGNCQPPVEADASIDGPPSGSEVCFGAVGDFFRTCLDPPPTNDRNFSGMTTIDTSDDLMCTQIAPQAKPPMVCVIAATNITVAGTLRVVGARPLVLFATNGLTITGTIDVASYSMKNGVVEKGAGANSGGDCNPAGPGVGSVGGGGGGGAGGALGDTGGIGGKSGGGFAGGTAPAMTVTDRIRGGCSGANGGKGAEAGGFSGIGGGAIYLMAKTQITLSDSAVINASGAGGRSAGIGGGGGGGGSGGFIGFHAPSFTILPNAKVYAVGGGGAQGGEDSMSLPGSEATGPMNAPATSNGGFGGTGAFGSAQGKGGTGGPGANATSTGGGGGGGSPGAIIFEGAVPSSAMTSNFKPNPESR